MQAQEKVGTSRCDVPRKLSGQRAVPTLTWVQLVIVLVLASVSLDAKEARGAIAEDRGSRANTADKPAFVFGGVGYFHRWSQNDQHEFTPTGQDDLQKWADMITINVYPSAHDGDALAVEANTVLELQRPRRPGAQN